MPKVEKSEKLGVFRLKLINITVFDYTELFSTKFGQIWEIREKSIFSNGPRKGRKNWKFDEIFKVIKIDFQGQNLWRHLLDPKGFGKKKLISEIPISTNIGYFSS